MPSPYRVPDSSPPPALPPAVSLGRLVGRADRKGHSLSYLVGLVAFAILGFGFLGLLTLVPQVRVFAWIALTLLTVLFLYLAWPAPAVAIALYEQGLVVESPRRPDTIAWRNVRFLHRTIRTVARPFRKRATTFGYRFVGFDGRTIDIPPGLVDPKLSDWIERRVSTPLIGSARASLRDGEPLVFGPITLDRSGITLDGDHLEWAELGDVAIIGSVLRIRRKNAHGAWGNVAIDAIPHPTVFTAMLTDHIRKGR